MKQAAKKINKLKPCRVIPLKGKFISLNQYKALATAVRALRDIVDTDAGQEHALVITQGTAALAICALQRADNIYDDLLLQNQFDRLLS